MHWNYRVKQLMKIERMNLLKYPKYVFPMNGGLTIEGAELLLLQTTGSVTLVLQRSVVTALALGACQGDDF